MVQTGNKGVEDLKSREPREGRYFIVGKALPDKVKFIGEPIDLCETLFTCYEGLDKVAQGFVSVELTAEQIKEQRLKIRIASYRWQPPFVGPRGAEGE